MVSYQQDEISDALSRIGLVYVSDTDPGYRRVGRGKGFAYYDNKDKLVKCEKTKNQLNSLAVPPSYSDVWYCKEENGYIRATGYDQTDKKQYFYHEIWEQHRDSRKFRHLADVANCLPSLRRHIRNDLKSPENDKSFLLACMARLLDKTGMRVGNMASAAERETYGLTTLQKRHIHIRDDKSLELNYTGKGNVKIQRKLCDSGLTTLLEDIIEEHDSWLFDYTDEKGETHKITPSMLNDYLKTHSSCDMLTAKDLRTWRFSVLFLEEALRQHKDDVKVTLTSVLEEISQITGNTPAILKGSYIHPGLLEAVKNENWEKIDLSEGPQVTELRKHENILKNYLGSRHAALHTSAINI